MAACWMPDAADIGMELADNAEERYPSNERKGAAPRRGFDGAVKDG